MDKKVYIRDYDCRKKEIIIPDFEDVVELEVMVISGDEILAVLYKNGRIKKFDSSDDRFVSYYDGSYIVPLDKVDEFSAMDCDSYSVFEYFADLEGGKKNNEN